MSASAFEVWDADRELDGTEWSGFLGYSAVSPGLAAAMLRGSHRAALEHDDMFEGDDDER